MALHYSVAYASDLCINSSHINIDFSYVIEEYNSVTNNSTFCVVDEDELIERGVWYSNILADCADSYLNSNGGDECYQEQLAEMFNALDASLIVEG